MTISYHALLTRLCCGLFFLMAALPSQAQTLKKPVPAPTGGSGGQPWTQACASASFNDYWVAFEWNPPLVENDNEFILELSDASGSFSDPVVLDRKGDKNTDFDFHFNFTVPEGTAGESYRFRVRSTNPALTSPSSDAYPIYYMAENSGLTIRPQGQDDFGNGRAQVCDGNNITLEVYNLGAPESYTFQWYRSGTPLSETSHRLTVSQAGMYNVEINYGTCSGSGNTLSNMIDVSLGSSQGIVINTPSKTILCEGETEVLEASISGMGYTYSWFLDGALVAGPAVDAHTYTVDAANAGFAGNYQVEISGNGICQERSPGQTMNSAGSFSANRDNPEKMILLPGQDLTLSVSTDAVAPSYQWFRDGTPVSGATNATLILTDLTQAGTYRARITENGGSCVSSEDSAPTEVVIADHFEISIAHAGAYEACGSETTVLELASITAVEANGERTDVTASLNEAFAYQWDYEGAPLNGANSKNLSLTNMAENGNYTLGASLDTYESASNTIEVRLRSSEDLQIEASSLISCGEASPLSLSTETSLEGVPHTWYYNGNATALQGALVSAWEAGSYRLEVQRNGCPVRSNEIIVRPLDAEAIGLDTDGPIVFPEGTSKTVTASGADQYRWYDSANNELSTGPSITFTEEGSYLLVATVGACTVHRTFKVEYLDTFRVPNVISVNGDGINDLWILPNSYSNKPDVRVVLYNERGEEVFNQANYKNNWPSATERFARQNMVFYYTISENGDILKQGTVTVIR